MSRITGSDAKALMEAYAAVYAPQHQEVVEEIFEDDVEQIDEASAQGGRVTGSNPTVYKAAERPAGTRRGAAAGTRQRPAAAPAPKPAAAAPATKPAAPAPKPAAAAPATKPAAPAPKPASKVAPAAPAAKPAPGSTTSKPITSQPAVSKSQSSAAEIRGMIGRSMQRQASAPAPKPATPVNKATGSKKPGSAFEQYDAYDVVLEYLFDNGHVDTVEEAHYVMMEMDAEMIANICEGIDFKGAAREQARRDAEQEKRDKEVPTNKERRLMMGRFRPGASSAERAEGGRDALKQKGKVPKKGGKDMFEQVLEHLISEGYAETEEAAREIIANMSEGWIQSIVEEFLDEEEGSYGATPKAYSAARGTKMTAKRKPFLKKMLSRTNPANRTPDDSPRKGMTSDDRERARAGSKHGVGTRQDHDYPSEGPGGVTKSAKKLRKQKAMGEFSEEAFAAWIDEAMTNYEKNRKRAAQRAAARNAARDQGKTGAVPGVGYVTPRRERETWTDESGKTRHAKGL